MLVDQSIIETLDNCFFTIIGNVHPPGRYVGLLAYVPYKSSPHLDERFVSPKEIGSNLYTKISAGWFAPHRGYYFKQIRDYEHYLYEDPFFGLVTSVPENSIKQIIKPQPVSDAVSLNACFMLGIPPESAVLVGSSMIKGCVREDIDLGIVGKNTTTQAVKNLRQLLSSNPASRVHHDYFNCIHPRQFMCSRKKVDLYPLYGQDDVQTFSSVPTQIEGPFEIDSVVSDEFDGAFRPSVYRLHSNTLFATYDIEHRMILRAGDKVKLRNVWRTDKSYLVRLGDGYRDITADNRFTFVDTSI